MIGISIFAYMKKGLTKLAADRSERNSRIKGRFNAMIKEGYMRTEAVKEMGSEFGISQATVYLALKSK